MGGNGQASGRGQWSALTAALLGWMFDGLEMGLFPLVARPALKELLGSGADDQIIGRWMGIATAGFLVGAATGGVVFGWLGDRLGRVRALTLSVLTYALFSGACCLAQAPWVVVVLRFLAALGMGGEWSLGVALVMEVWPNRSRALLAGLIGAAANAGYMLIAIVGLSLSAIPGPVGNTLRGLGLPETWVDALVANSGWRLLMLLAATPALLTFFIRLFVPESQRWEEQRARGATSAWAARDLLVILLGVAGCAGLIALWAAAVPWLWLLLGSAAALLVITGSYLYPAYRYVSRTAESEGGAVGATMRRMLLGACISGVPLLATWGAIQNAPSWADKLAEKQHTLQDQGAPPVPVGDAKAATQIFTAIGAIIGTILAAFLGDWLGRRISYIILCLVALGSSLLFFLTNDFITPYFFATAFLAGGCSAAFYGWLPLYLPELFRTRVRATGQGFSFNFGRILAAMGALQFGTLVKLFDNDFARPSSLLSLIYLLGPIIIWLAPETRGRPLPE
jgi:MFS family permease